MKKGLLILLCLPMIGFGQGNSNNKSDNTKNINYLQIQYPASVDFDKNYVNSEIRKLGYNIVSNLNIVENSCEIAKVKVSQELHHPLKCGDLSIEIFDCENNLFFSKDKIAGGLPWASTRECYGYATKRLATFFKKEFKKIISLPNKTIKNTTISPEAFEESQKQYLDTSSIESIEGIYTMSGIHNYRLSIIKKDNLFLANVISSNNPLFNTGDIKIIFEPLAAANYYNIKFLDAQKAEFNTIAELNSSALITFSISNLEIGIFKIYPAVKGNDITRGNGWRGNGSGIIISKSGYIITNHHVIEDANDIEVVFILDDEVQKYNAEIVQSDKVNDLAIIKIVDVNFDGVKELPYNFKTRSSDVGTKVYAFGYPMALTIMGKEIKVTDGIISSKTGYDGDITKYQISAPIQAGNSGGPLFDDKGNFIGINSAKLNVKIADNVGYSIKTSYVLNLIDILPKTIDLPSNKKLASLPLTEQIKEISKYVVLVKVK